MKPIAIVVPCYNESIRFSTTYWCQILDAAPQVDWLFVDDGSTDSTKEMLSKFCEQRGSSLLALNKNQGKGNAIRLGFQKLISNNQEITHLGYLDSDGAFSISDVQRLLSITEHMNEVRGNLPWDVIISSRVAMAGRQIDRKITRHYLGRIFATYLTRGWRGAPYDTQCGFKIFKMSQELEDSLAAPFRTRWFVDLELISRLELQTKHHLKIWEEPLVSWTDVDGSKIILKHALAILNETKFARKQVKKFLRMKMGKHGLN
jgi:glycosyltransferase involved in cell wall biosynthesis